MSRYGSVSELAHGLARYAEAVCRTYLTNGRRVGNYWIVGDVRNTKGRSMHVRLKDSGPKRAGKWFDEATGEHGDLLDVIEHSRGLLEFRDILDEARRFLAEPPPEPASAQREPSAARGSPDAARRLFAMSRPIAGTLGERYLAARSIPFAARERALRFHPGCYYRDLATGETLTLPALIAAVTGLDGKITGLHRTWLDPDGDGKAHLPEPRRSLGHLLGNGIWLGMTPGMPAPAAISGEGLETMLSLRMVMPALPMVAATSAGHLGGIAFPIGCERLYIAADADAAGRHGIERLARRAEDAGILPLVLRPQLGDFNDDLRGLGPDHLAAWLRGQMDEADTRLCLLPS